MTVTSFPVRDEYTAAASQTVFNYTFLIFASGDLDVYITPAGQEPNDTTYITTAYTVDSGTIGNPVGGFITLDSGTSAGDLVTIVSALDYNRIVDYQNSGDFLPATVNGDNDRQVSQIKQVADIASRSLVFQQSLQNASSLSLPNPSAGLYLKWKSDLTGLENTGVPGQIIQGTNIGVVSDMIADTTIEIGDFIFTTGYTSSGDGGDNSYQVVASGTGTADGGSYIDLTGSGHQAKGLFPRGVINARQFGALGDGSTVDTVGLQAALDYLPDNSILNIEDGTYITGRLDLDSKTDITIQGRAILMCDPVANENLFLVTNSKRVKVVGLTFDGNNTLVSNINVLVSASGATQTNIVYDNCRFQNTYSTGFGLSGCRRSGIVNCRFVDVGNFHDTSGDPDDRRNGYVCNIDSRDCFCNYSTFSDIGRGCISFSLGTGAAPLRPVAIGNTIITCDGGAVYFSGATDFICNDNHVQTGSAVAANGIEFENCLGGIASNNIAEGNGGSGMSVGYTSSNIIFIGNVCRNNNQVEESDRAGILLIVAAGDTLSDITLTGNHCYDDQGSNNETQLAAVSFDRVAGAGSFDMDTIRIDDTNSFIGYRALGGIDYQDMFVGNENGIAGAFQKSQVISLDDLEEFTVMTDAATATLEVTVLNAYSYGKFTLRAGTSPKEILDPDGVFETTDIGTNYSIYNGSGFFRLKNRFGSARVFNFKIVDYSLT